MYLPCILYNFILFIQQMQIYIKNICSLKRSYMLECFNKQLKLKYIVHLLNKCNKQYGLKFRQLLL